MNEHLLCCDWGTSSFRLRLVAIKTMEILNEVISSDGISSVFTDWEDKSKSDGLNREAFYKQQLQSKIAVISQNLNMPLGQIPIVISGMASSSLGMKEIPYATIPFAIDGSQTSAAYFESTPDFPHEIILISGVKSDLDVMRGEETQLIGLVNLLGLSGLSQDAAIFIFPGTHSKHIQVQQGELVSFQTFMTGEVFSLLANHSILKDSVTGSETSLNPKELEAFIAGIQESGNLNLLNSLFKVRTNHLFNKLGKKQNFLFLSGLLIGTELRTLLNQKGALILCSGNNLFEYYQLAIAELGLSHRTQTVAPDIIDKAAISGQITIFQQHTSSIKLF